MNGMEKGGAKNRGGGSSVWGPSAARARPPIWHRYHKMLIMWT